MGETGRACEPGHGTAAWGRRITLAGAAWLLAGSANAAEFVVSWVEIQQEVRPRQATWKVNKSVHLTLQGGNKITEHSSAEAASGKTSQSNNQGRFGETMVSGSNDISWRVESDNTLVRVKDRPQHIETMRITLADGNTCRATIAFELKPAFKEYHMRAISNGRDLYFSVVVAEKINCTAAD